MYIPKIIVTATYESSGVLILVPASGGGRYSGEYDGVKIKIYLKADQASFNDETYFVLEQMKMDFSVEHIKMEVDGIHNQNSVIQAALNLFINSNAQELLKEMKPAIKTKILGLTKQFAKNLFIHIPYDDFLY